MNGFCRNFRGLGLMVVWMGLGSDLCIGQTLYSFGNPSAEEQLYLEYINRARANPSAEGERLATSTDADLVFTMNYFKVDRALFRSEMNALPATAPLAPNASLTTAARGHSQWMLTNAKQEHNQANPANTPDQRMRAAGYDGLSWAENIYAYAKNVLYGHAGFEVDWGPGGTGGMLAGRGHRVAIHNAGFREIGVGVVNGTNGLVGPQLVTQDFGVRSNGGYFATGVAYFDLNSNNFYDIGEGIPGLTVTMVGASHYCVSAAGGGWVLPLPSSTTQVNRTVTFSSSGFQQSVSVDVPVNRNVKADLKLNYSAPVVSSPATAWVNHPVKFTFSAAPGASQYQWSRWGLDPAPAENCNDKNNVTVSLTGNYSGLNTALKFEGTAAFQLVNSGSANNQFIELNPTYFGGGAPSFSFRSRMGLATSSIIHKVQFREINSTVWQDCYTQAGPNDKAETTFSLRTISLPTMAGKSFKLRFFSSFTTGGTTYTNVGNTYGWMFDAIQFSQVFRLGSATLESLTQSSATFTPPSQGSYLMAIAPQIAGKVFPAGVTTLQAVPPPSPSFNTWATGQELASGLAPGTLTVPHGDHDNDGLENLIEYAFGSSAVMANGHTNRMPVARMSETHYVLRYQRDTALTDVVLTPQASANLTSWKAPLESGAPPGFSDVLISSVGGIETREARVPKSTGGACFMKLKVIRP